jgi:hypothetical protein
MITLSVFLLLSLVVNGVLIWYCRQLVKQFSFFSENLDALEEVLVRFENHLTGVHELDMFYGDDTLGGLIEHSKLVTQRLKDFSDEFSQELEEEGEVDGGS